MDMDKGLEGLSNPLLPCTSQLFLLGMEVLWGISNLKTS